MPAPARPDAAARRGAGTPGRRHLLPLVAGLVAVLSALALPFLPVTVNDPVVQWPQDAAAPESTSLQLSAYKPRELTVDLGCDALRAADTAPDGVAFATMRPDRPEARGDGLLVEVTDGRAVVTSTGQVLAELPVPAGDCALTVRGDTSGVVVRLDGEVAGRGPDGVLPDVDALVTSVPAGAVSDRDDLGAQVRVNDQFSTSPTALKSAVTLLAVLAALAAVAALVVESRRTGRRTTAPAPRLRPRLRPVDAVVVLALGLWVFLGPMTDDDGYYSAMARNVPAEGYVGNYYQLFNSTFAPFTWFYYALSSWQQLVGFSPVALRIPAAVGGGVAWFLLRALVSRREPEPMAAVPAELGTGRSGGALVRGLLALAFLAWYLPYDIGVRPESAVAVLATAVLVTVVAAIRRASLPLLAVAFGLAALGCAAHPTGFVALAPLLVALPRLWRLVVDSAATPLHRLSLAAGVVATGAFAAVAAFADGTWYEFVRGQEIFLAVTPQQDWSNEIDRYQFLLTGGPMGAYAKRLVVLLALLGLVWALVLAVAARARRVPLPVGYELVAATTALSFLLLWITPSKWTHHFGSMAGPGAAFLALTIVIAPVAARRLLEGRRLPWPVAAAALVSVSLVAALSFRGPNTWAYSWLLGMPQALETARLGPLPLGSLVLWLAGSLVLTGIATVVLRRRAAAPRLGSRPAGAPPAGDGATAASAAAASTATPAAGTEPSAPALAAAAVPAVALFLGLAYLLATFGYATVATWDTYSYSAAALRSPTGCSAAEAVLTTDPATARPLPAVAGTPGAQATGFEQGDGWIGAFPPPEPTGTPGGPTAYGSFRDGPGEQPEDAMGSVTTPWVEVPEELPGGERGVVLVSGRVDAPVPTDVDRPFAEAAADAAPGTNQLAVEYGRATGGDVEVLDRRGLGDDGDSPVWRSLALDLAGAPEDADVVRLVAVDDTTGIGGWLTAGEPTLQRERTVQQAVGGDVPTALSWQLALWFPCQEPPAIQDGIVTPVAFGVTWPEGGQSGLYDFTWRDFRGGLFGQLLRTATATQLLTRVEGAPASVPVSTFVFDQPYAGDAYALTRTRETVSGLSGPEWGWSMDHVDTRPS